MVDHVEKEPLDMRPIVVLVGHEHHLAIPGAQQTPYVRGRDQLLPAASIAAVSASLAVCIYAPEFFQR